MCNEYRGYVKECAIFYPSIDFVITSSSSEPRHCVSLPVLPEYSSGLMLLSVFGWRSGMAVNSGARAGRGVNSGSFMIVELKATVG